MYTKSKGFTLIELIVAIVVVGILAVIAIPTYQSLASDARINTMKSVAAALRASSNQIKIQTQLPNTPKTLVTAQSGPNLQVHNVTIRALRTINDQPLVVKTYNGYIDGLWQGSWQHILDIGKEIDFTHPEDKCTKHELCGVGSRRTVSGFP